MADKSFTTADVGTHNNDENGYWLIVENNVYDVTSAFFPLPPSIFRRQRNYHRERERERERTSQFVAGEANVM